MITKSSKEVIIYHVILHWPVDIDRLKKLKWRPINPVSIEIWNSIQLLHIIEYIQQYFSYVVAFSYIGGGSRNDHGYVPPVVNTSWSFSHTWFITGFVTRLTRRVLLVEQQLLTHPEHLSSSPVYNGVRVTWSLVLCVYFVDRCLSFFFCHYVVCSFLIYGFWLPLWYLQTLPTRAERRCNVHSPQLYL